MNPIYRYWNTLRQWLSRKRQPTAQADKEHTEATPSTHNNPYLNSRALWNELYGDAESRYHHSRRINQGLVVCVGLSMVALWHHSLQSHTIPYVVTVQNGQVIYAASTQQVDFKQVRPALAGFFMEQFLRQARSVSIDAHVEKSEQQGAFSVTEGVATSTLQSFFKQRHPIETAQHRWVSVDIHYLNALSPHTFQIGWSEVAHDNQTGDVIDKKNFIAQLHYRWGTPPHQPLMRSHNPLGFYITHIAWTGVIT